MIPPFIVTPDEEVVITFIVKRSLTPTVNAWEWRQQLAAGWDVELRSCMVEKKQYPHDLFEDNK